MRVRFRRQRQPYWIGGTTAVTVLILAACLSQAASASRDLTVKERRAILRAQAFLGPNGRRILDPACISGRLSTVNRRWASAYLANTRSCVRRFGGASGESALLHRPRRTSRKWRQVGSIGDNCSPGEGGASAAVLEDLGCYLGAMSSGAGVYVNCFTGGATFEPHRRRHPAACVFQGEPEITANMVIGRKLRWTHWGSATAYATGLQDSNHPGQYPGGHPPPTALSVRLSHRVRGCGGRSFYTRLTFVGTRGHLRLTAGCHSIPLEF